MNRRARENWFERWGETVEQSEAKERARLEAEEKEARRPRCPWCGDPVEKVDAICIACVLEAEW